MRPKYKEFQKVFELADAAGKEAADAAVPTPMVVVQREDPLDDKSKVVKRYAPIMGGACGFAWVNISPANTSVAYFAKKHWNFSKAYYGGINMSIRGYGQSYETKMAYAEAFAGVLREADVNAYAGGRLD